MTAAQMKDLEEHKEALKRFGGKMPKGRKNPKPGDPIIYKDFSEEAIKEWDKNKGRGLY